MLTAYCLLSLLLTPVLLADAVPKSSEIQQAMPLEIKPPLGLPPVPWPEDNPYSQGKAELGRYLYYDTRLSSDNSVSCASCHNIPCGYGDCRKIAVGIGGSRGSRNSPTIINTAYLKHFFWDGRASSLEEQCKGPIANDKEMTNAENAHEAHLQCEERVGKIPGYQKLFKEVFNGEVTLDNIAKAIATFERTLLSGNSSYDRYRAGNPTAMTAQEIKGWELFKKHNCSSCHGGFNFTDDRFTNIGVGMDKADPDPGRYGITHYPSQWGAFKIPTLRDVAHTGPYMHDGSLTTLREVIDYYDKGGIPNKRLHPLMQPLHLQEEDKDALVAFLKALSGEGWQHGGQPSSFP